MDCASPAIVRVTSRTQTGATRRQIMPNSLALSAGQLLLQRVAIQAAQSEPGAVPQHHLVIAAAGDQQLLHALDVDDARAVDAEEAVRADLVDQPANREFIEGEQTLIAGTRWIAKLSGLYELPWGINVAVTLNAREGFPFIPNILSPNRPNGLGTIRVMVEPYATSRYGNLALVDMKAEKKITLDKLSINASLDVFNLFNSNTVLARVTTQNSATANRVTEVTGPRVLRFGLRFTF